MSVRARTVLLATLVVALALAGGGVGLMRVLRAELVDNRDAAAVARLHDLAELAASGALPPVLGGPTDDDFAQAVGPAGDVVAASPGRAGAPVATFDVPAGETAVRDLKGVPDGADTDDYRVWAQGVSSPDGLETVYVGVSLSTVDETVATVRRLLLVGLPLLLAVFVGVAWLVMGRALRPVERIRAEVENITAQALDRRVPQPKTSDEIGRLAATMNTMLDRLQSSSDQQRAFVADAAHELQSPLTSLRTQLEVARASSAETDWPDVSRRLLAASGELEALVRDLLFLARVEEEGPHRRTVMVDLDDVVLEEAKRVGTMSVVAVDTRSVSAAPVRGSREELIRMTRNLLENAVLHASTRVAVALGGVDGQATLVVEDDGPGVAPDDRVAVFERFIRIDPARPRGREGTGLGLAIVKAIVIRHGGLVEVQDACPGAKFVVRLPASQPRCG